MLRKTLFVWILFPVSGWSDGRFIKKYKIKRLISRSNESGIMRAPWESFLWGKLSSVVRAPQYSPLMKTGPESRSLRRRLCLNGCESSGGRLPRQSEEQIPERGTRRSLSVQKSLCSWRVHFMWAMCEVSKRPRSTEACCYETYRVQRGTVQRSFRVRQTDRQTNRKRRILQPCWCSKLGMLY